MMLWAWFSAGRVYAHHTRAIIDMAMQQAEVRAHMREFMGWDGEDGIAALPTSAAEIKKTTWRFHRRPGTRVARPRPCISDAARCPGGHLLAVERGRRVAPAPRHRPKTPSRPDAPTNMGVIDWTQPLRDPHDEPLRRQDRSGGAAAGPPKCPMTEVGQGVEVAVTSASAPGPDGRYQIPVKVQGGIHQALLSVRE